MSNLPISYSTTCLLEVCKPLYSSGGISNEIKGVKKYLHHMHFILFVTTSKIWLLASKSARNKI